MESDQRGRSEMLTSQPSVGPNIDFTAKPSREVQRVYVVSEWRIIENLLR